MKTVLIAEDDPAIAEILATVIAERLSVATHSVANGALVLDALSAHQPDLIVLDLSLPGLSGLDVFDVVRNDPAGSGLPVLFLTAAPDRADKVSARTGQHRVMGKPFDLDALVAEVASLLSEAEAAA